MAQEKKKMIRRCQTHETKELDLPSFQYLEAVESNMKKHVLSKNADSHNLVTRLV